MTVGQDGATPPDGAARPGVGRRAAIYLSLAAASQVLVGSRKLATSGADALDPLRIAGGLRGGVYDAWAHAVAGRLASRRPAQPVAVVASGGSVSNLRMLAAGDAAVALASLDFSAQYLTSAPPGDPPVQALARLYDDYVHLLVQRGSPIRSATGLAGRSVVVGARQSGTSFVAGRILDGLSVRPAQRVELDLTSALDALVTGDVDAVFWSGGLPTRAVREAWGAHDLRLVPLPGAADTLRRRYGALYRSATMPAEAYAGTRPVTTVALANLLLARSDLPATIPDRLLRTIFADRAAIARAVPAFTGFSRFSAIQSQPVPLHPGAVAFYRRQLQ